MKERVHLPNYGVGPLYGISIVVITILGMLVTYKGIFDFAKFTITQIPFLIVGIIIGILGLYVWIRAAIRIDHYVNHNVLCINGIYGIVRNPCYSGVMLICTGALLIANNVCLLVLPILYWIFLTVLLKNTEEKWLLELYGEQYREYCKRVNRCIPWFSRKVK